MKCTHYPDKKAYNTLKVAERAVTRYFIRMNTKLYSYKCNGCKKYHLTKQRPS